MILLAIGLTVGLVAGSALMAWWSSRRIEREAARQFEMGVAQGLRAGPRPPERGGRAATDEPRRRREALLDSSPATRKS